MRDLVDEIEDQTSGISQHQREQSSIPSGSGRELMSSVEAGIHEGTLNISPENQHSRPIQTPKSASSHSYSTKMPMDRKNPVSSARRLRNYQAHVSSEDEEHIEVISRSNSSGGDSDSVRIRRRPDASYDNYKAEEVREGRPTNRRSQYNDHMIAYQNKAHDMVRDIRLVQPEQPSRREATQNRRRIRSRGRINHTRRMASRERFYEQPPLGRYTKPERIKHTRRTSSRKRFYEQSPLGYYMDPERINHTRRLSSRERFYEQPPSGHYTEPERIYITRRTSSRERFDEQPLPGLYMEPHYRRRGSQSPLRPLPSRPYPFNYERPHDRSRLIYPEEDIYDIKYDRFGAEPDFESLYERNSEEDWDSDAFLFKLSGHARLTPSEETLLDTEIFETLEKDGTEVLLRLSGKSTGVQSRGKMYHVVQSRYTSSFRRHGFPSLGKKLQNVVKKVSS